jgi:hypothetical protein
LTQSIELNQKTKSNSLLTEHIRAQLHLSHNEGMFTVIKQALNNGLISIEKQRSVDKSNSLPKRTH